MYSTGSSMVIMLRSGLFSSPSDAYSVVVLPLPVGPAQITMPYGAWMQPAVAVATVSAGMPSWLEAVQRSALVQQPHHHLLAADDGGGGDADVHLAALDLHADLPVLRAAALDDVHAAEDLDPAHHGRADRPRQVEHVVQRAVDAVAHPDPVLARLDVDVGGAVAQALVMIS